jgi:hypothetical protein
VIPEPGQTIDLEGFRCTVARVVQRANIINDAPCWSIYREPDGRLEFTVYESDLERIEVVG